MFVLWYDMGYSLLACIHSSRCAFAFGCHRGVHGLVELNWRHFAVLVTRWRYSFGGGLKYWSGVRMKDQSWNDKERWEADETGERMGWEF